MFLSTVRHKPSTDIKRLRWGLDIKVDGTSVERWERTRCSGDVLLVEVFSSSSEVTLVEEEYETTGNYWTSQTGSPLQPCPFLHILGETRSVRSDKNNEFTRTA